MYVEVMPCMDCARAIVQAGIVEVVVNAERMQRYSSEKYDPHFEKAEILFKEAKVDLKVVPMQQVDPSVIGAAPE